MLGWFPYKPPSEVRVLYVVKLLYFTNIWVLKKHDEWLPFPMQKQARALAIEHLRLKTKLSWLKPCNKFHGSL